MPDCHRKGYERGLWYEIECIKETIATKEKMGKDASFEKELLRAYKKVGNVPAMPSITIGKSKSSRVKGKVVSQTRAERFIQ